MQILIPILIPAILWEIKKIWFGMILEKYNITLKNKKKLYNELRKFS